MTLAVQNDLNDPARALLRRVKLLAPTIGYWHGTYHIPNATVSLDGHTLDAKKTTKPQVKLLEQTDELKNFKTRFTAINSALVAAKDAYSEPFPITGVRQIPITAVEPFLYEVVGKTGVGGTPVYDPLRHVPRTDSTEQSVAYRLHELADEFAENWYRIRDTLATSLDAGLWSQIKKKVPADSRSIRKKFYFDIAVVELAVGANDDVEAAASTIDDTFGSYVRASLSRQIDTAIEQMVAGPREALAKALRELNELILRNGNVTSRSFNGVRAAIDKLRMFEFAADRSILDDISRLERRIGNTEAASLDASSASANGFLELTNAVIRTAEDVTSQEAAIAKFGRAGRSVMI
jgi:hypothetical protein